MIAIFDYHFSHYTILAVSHPLVGLVGMIEVI